MKVVIPPIKSQGIKTKLVPWIMSLVPADITGRWVEPFLGTGVVALNSGFREAILADVNPYVIDFYDQIQKGYITPSDVRAYLEYEGELLRSIGHDHFRHVRERFNQ